MGTITTPGDLPSVGAPETTALDFKAKYDEAGKSFEIAKDVAALANANGGTLLIGAAESRPVATLGGYVPFDEPTAAKIKKDVDLAVIQRCSPAPFISPVSIARPEGGWVVAVNVSAHPTQAVGVKIAGHSADGYGDPAWVFPVRVGTQTDFIPPEVLAMMMVPEIRRKALMLDAIPIPCRREVEVEGAYYQTAGAAPAVNPVQLVSVDQRTNTVCLRSVLSGYETEIRFPLDDVEAVWEARKDKWRIRLRGGLMRTNSPTPGLEYRSGPRI